MNDLDRLPVDWNEKPLGQFLKSSPTYGINAPSVEFDGRLPTYLRITDINDSGRFRATSPVSVDHLLSSHYILCRGDIVVARTGATVGKSYIYRHSDAKHLVFAGFLIRLQADETKLLPSYLFQFMQTQRYWSWVRENSMRSGQPGVNGRQFTVLPMCVPPTLTEQEAIASALSDADALIESLEQLLAKKRLIKQAAMQELLTGDWPSKAFGDLFKSSGGYSASRNDLGSDGHLYLHYGDIHGSDRTFVDVEADGGDIPRIDIPLSEVSPASLLDDGDVVFVDASEDVDGTNKHVVIDNPEARPFISGLHTIVAKRKTNEINPRYMRYCFQTPEIKEQFRFYAVGTKVSGVSKTSIAKIVLAVPSPHEQSEIAATLDAMEHEIELVIERLAKARQLKQAMMQQLLTGRIRLV